MLIGNLTRDPELRSISTGSQVCELGLAVNRTWTEPDGQKREEVTYLDIAFWGRTAENAAKYLAKGRSVYIEGRLQVDTWQDAQSGQERQKLKIIGERLQFLGGAANQSATNFTPTEAEPADNQPPTPPKGGQTAQARPRYQGRAA